MNIPPKIIYGIDDEVKQNLDSNILKYFDICKLYLEFDPLSMKDSNTIFSESSRFYRYSFPPNISEYFFRYEEAPLFWLCDSSLNKYLKDLYRHHFPVLNSVDQYKAVKELYSKWLTNKQEEEKKYFALSITNFIDNYNSRTNFLSNILSGIISSYEPSVYNPQRSIELFDKSKDIISKIKLSDPIKEELEYLITLYLGYSYIILQENELAKNRFEDALKLKSNGITAKFHLALANIKLQDIESAENYIKEIYDYDTQRINFAIENLSINLFNFFIENAVFNNIFYYPEFSLISENIESLLSLIKISNEPVIKILINKFEVLRVVIEEKQFPEEIVKNISFIEKVIKKYSDSNNIHFLNAAGKLKNIFFETIIKIKEEIKAKYYNKINEKVSVINEEIQMRSATLEKLKQELENQKNELKNKLSSGITNIENNITRETQVLEEEIKNLPLRPKLNPQTTFKHVMTYNIILSFMVFLMGGCAGYSNNFVHDISELKDLISISLITGTKWGAITFLIGIILSALSAMFTLLERSNRRQYLLQSISRLKNEKEYRINIFKKDIARKESLLINNFNVPIKENIERIEQLIKEKNSQESMLKEEADKLIKEECNPYAFILDEENPDIDSLNPTI